MDHFSYPRKLRVGVALKGSFTYKVWPKGEAGRQNFLIGVTFLLYELSESTAPFRNQQGYARRMVLVSVNFVTFGIYPIFNGFYH